MAAPIVLRPLQLKEPSEYNYVLKSWLSALRQNIAHFRHMDDEVFSVHRGAVISAIDRGSTLLACNPDNPNHIYGFVVFERDVVHYIYVASLWRGNGIARALLARATGGSPFSYTHLGQRMNGRAMAKMKAKYNPYALYMLSVDG